jgi:RimJ/RimL family protein N-acetyltransferase
MPHITRVELVARASNARAQRLYQAFGFQAEGRLRGRIRNSDGRYDDDLPMAWLRG